DIGDVPMAAAFDLETIIEEIRNFYAKLHAAKVVPLTVGGDHSISFPILQALGSTRPVGLIHVDAISMSRNRFPVRRCTTERRSSMRYARASSIPNAPSTSCIRDPYAELEPFAVESGMTIIDINRFHDLGIARVIEVTRDIVGPGPTYITFDIDGLDPAFATGTPVVGGLTSYEAKRLLQGFRGLDIVGGDVVEVS